MTHSTNNCLERPRRRGAKLTGHGIRPDEVIGSVNLDFEGKRDRWNGYDDREFSRTLRQKGEAEGVQNDVHKKAEHSSAQNSSSSDDSDDSDGEEDGKVVQQSGESAKTSVRNLRIREDTAKYLYNLDLNSAFYDPKSRSMRADPLPNVDPDDKDYAGDNFVRFSGDVTTLAKMELTTRKASSTGKQLPHLQAEPSRAEAVFREFETRKKDLQEKRRAQIVKKYGGQEHSVPQPGISDVAEVGASIGYDAEGNPKKGGNISAPVSAYPEDVLEKNHKDIWGSFYEDGKWGYACCRQTQRYAFCTGEAGRVAAIETRKEMEKRVAEAVEKRDPRTLVEQYAERRDEEEKVCAGNEKDRAKALKEEQQHRIRLEHELRKQRSEDTRVTLDDRQRKYNSVSQGGPGSLRVSEEEMEAYRMRRQMKEDPMNKFLSRNS
ncbi:hypothetical protein FGB62_4g246 [Gracilaria domingensis]|nr:hypothetical protein FGB62_4g246 [Gracilaria domingensis]